MSGIFSCQRTSKKVAKTSKVESVELSFKPSVSDPGLATIEKGGGYSCLIDLEHCLGT